MTHALNPDGRRAHGPADAWVQCGCGQRHWGTAGAAGLLLADGGPTDVAPTRVVLQFRAAWSHHGGTWGVPGGALDPDEDSLTGALREAEEEAGIPPAAVAPLATSVLRHPDWSYTTVLGRTVRHVDPAPTDAESAEVAWVDVDEVVNRPLLPAFAEAWPSLATLLRVRPVLVVDAANVVGSRPDGWWRDRAGAASRLAGELAALAARGVPAGLLGLPADHWWPEVVMVVEGAARGITIGPDDHAVSGAGQPGPVLPRVRIVDAAGSGDDEIVRQVVAARAPATPARAPTAPTSAVAGPAVTVATSDRGLRERVSAAGGRWVGVSALRAHLDSAH
ncbi:NUDIX hydrolase [Occultella glacieicola]|uniref:8-oxo-dGTP diphosphatase n=1 Tax=Occultella glacieicola TaxID=2518684 RepID=A0ABY2E2N0_9MICO|nr:NUDIX hydrolase [Occultella glacieicola]TDE93882.1 NUDIX hydrolase [Occultella glacieicola]